MDWRVIAAIRAAERSAAAVHRDFACGLDGLATVAATAPFMGMFATAFGILGSFRGIDGNKATIMGSIANYLSLALAPAALGLAIAILASAGNRHLRARLAEFDMEMQHAARAIPDYLGRPC